MTADHGYLLDNQQPEAPRRFDALATLFDPSTFRHLEAVGTGPGWRCWEVGAGGPSVVEWLVSRVGSDGQVLATDIDTSHITGPAAPTLEVRRHDVGLDPSPSGGFDLVHARLVLVHVAERDRALASMVDSLRPGGWLVVEDADPALQPLICPDEFGPEQELANRLRRDFRSLMIERGVDLAYGRTLPRRLREAGLEAVEADAYFPITSSACTALELATVEQIRQQLVSSGMATEEDIDLHLGNVASGRLDLATSPMVSSWGRKPPRS
jgi:ubiquinone/menaquinone biosynthesis C-methylase UbiE